MLNVWGEGKRGLGQKSKKHTVAAAVAYPGGVRATGGKAQQTPAHGTEKKNKTRENDTGLRARD